MTKTQEPYFSIIIPAYNAEAYLPAALESILNQTETDWELILIDDCSSDRSYEIFSTYAAKEPRIRLLKNPQNLKTGATLNRGIQAARGEWIVRLDADDFFCPNYLTSLRAQTQNAPWNYFFSCWATVVDEAGEKILDIRLPDSETIRRMMKIENFLYHGGTSFTKRLWEKVGGYPEDPAIAEDTGMWIRFFEARAKLVMIPDFLVNYRIHYSNITSVIDAKLFESGPELERKTIRQNKEWKISLYLKQKNLEMARSEILTLGRLQKRLSLKNLQYFFLTFLPKSFVHFFMWEFRPRIRSLIKSPRPPSLHS